MFLYKYFHYCLTALVIFYTNSFAFTDLGVWGAEYPITESIDLKENKIPQINEHMAEQMFKKAITSQQKLSDCNQTRDRTFNPEVVLEHDINMPQYKVFVKKGTKFNYLELRKMQRYMMMIDGNNTTHVEFAKHYLPVSDVVVYNGSTEVIENWADGHVYIADESFQKAFNVQCLPSVFIQKNNEFLIREYNLRELTHEN